MISRVRRGLGWVAMFGCCAQLAAAEPVSAQEAPPEPVASAPFLLGPPPQAGPVEVVARFELNDINEIDDLTETFEFAGVLTLRWSDPRQAFDPAVEGVSEKVFQGGFQFNELTTGWYPQVVLVNEAGMFQTSGVVLRIGADGASTLIATLNAVAEAELDMTRFPFDAHRLEAVFEVLGFDREEVVFRVDAGATGAPHAVRIPQWAVTGVDLSVRERSAPHAGRLGVASTFVVSADVERESFYARRLVVIPLVVIVLLSFSVFWMGDSSLGDRNSVSFIGILTAVAYQLVISEQLPRISYVTLIHGFLIFSFLIMSATVVVNLVVGALDREGREELGNRIDRHCRWLFPLGYVALNLTMMWVAFTFL